MRSPSWLRYDVALIAVGVLLLVNPLYVGALHLDDPNWYRYEASRVEFTDDGVVPPMAGGDIDGDVACLDRNFRVCRMGQFVYEKGGLSYPEARPGGPGDEGYRHAYIDGEFYRVQPQSSTGGTATNS